MPGRLLNIARPGVSPDRSTSLSATPAASRPSPDAPSRNPTRPAMDALKRHSLGGLAAKKLSDKDKDKEKERDRQGRKAEKEKHKASPSPSGRARKPNTRIEILVESPPNLFQGPSSTSPGALFSAQLRVVVTDPEITLSSFVMNLVADITTRKPVVHSCANCSTHSTDLFKWNFITEPKRLTAGVHSFPFSYMLPGHLPVTTHGGLGDLSYNLKARAVTTSGENIDFKYALPIARAIQAVADKNGLRVFPPTNLTANVSFAPVIHPIGQSTVLLRVNGIASTSDKVQHRWRLRKMNWRIEETEKMISIACDKHKDKVGGEGKGIQHEETRVIGHAELREGWKTDFADGTIELEFTCRMNGAARPLCDMESPTGMSVKHALVMELVISEEWANTHKLTLGTPTGAARVLRMQFNVTVTERQGLGVSWDEEIPPTYEDVPASPPLYSALTGNSAFADYHDAGLDEPVGYDDVERFSLNEVGPAAPEYQLNAGEGSSSSSSRI